MLALCCRRVVQIPGQDATSSGEAAPDEVILRAFYQYSIPALWCAWLIYWSLAAIGAKPTRRQESFVSRVSHVVPLGLAFALLASQQMPAEWLSQRFVPRTAFWFWCGFVLVVLGLGLAVAARIALGRNWSGMVTLKQEHELIRSGAYRWVRHPIYTGLLLAFAGSAVALGQWRSLLALAFATVAFLRKIAVEERYLLQEFGADYRRYREQVPALLPLPWG